MSTSRPCWLCGWLNSPMPPELSESGPASHRGDPSEKTRIMVEEDVNYTTATFFEYDMWLRYASSTLPRCTSWNCAFSGGEGMSYNLAREILSLKIPNLRIFNGYGPAETTILSTKIELPDPIPAGFMLPGFPVALCLCCD